MSARKYPIGVQSFEKILLISTLEAYFLGKKELFEGLAMESSFEIQLFVRDIRKGDPNE